jgi:hypothetical protein
MRPVPRPAPPVSPSSPRAGGWLADPAEVRPAQRRRRVLIGAHTTTLQRTLASEGVGAGKSKGCLQQGSAHRAQVSQAPYVMRHSLILVSKALQAAGVLCSLTGSLAA